MEQKSCLARIVDIVVVFFVAVGIVTTVVFASIGVAHEWQPMREFVLSFLTTPEPRESPPPTAIPTTPSAPSATTLESPLATPTPVLTATVVRAGVGLFKTPDESHWIRSLEPGIIIEVLGRSTNGRWLYVSVPSGDIPDQGYVFVADGPDAGWLTWDAQRWSINDLPDVEAGQPAEATVQSTPQAQHSK